MIINSILTEAIHFWTWFVWFSSQSFFNPLVALATVILLLSTTIIALRSTQAQQKSNELSILPSLIIEVIGPSHREERKVVLTNFGKGFAYDIKIMDWIHFNVPLNSRTRVWLKLPNNNILKPDQQTPLIAEIEAEGDTTTMGDFLFFQMQYQGREVYIYFRNQQGKKYYTKLKIHMTGTDLVVPPTKLTTWAFVNIEGDLLLRRLATNFWWGLILKLHGPFQTDDPNFRWWKLWHYFKK